MTLKNQPDEPMFTAVITAGGSSSRMKGADKLFMPICKIPVLARSMLMFQKAKCISDIIVVCRAENKEDVYEMAEKYGIGKFFSAVQGGDSRTESVFLGIAAVIKKNEKIGKEAKTEKEIKYIMVHDGARPLVSVQMINKVACSAVKNGAAIPAVPVKDTLKRTENGIIKETPDRKAFFAAQTPQAFDLRLYRNAVNAVAVKAEKMTDITDDSLIFEKAGIPVAVVEGEYKNIKITTPEDLIIAEALLMSEMSKINGGNGAEYVYKDNDKEFPDNNDDKLKFRIGHGYDVHKFAENRRLVLCGIEIPHEQGLLGHSDADVAVHAVMDAVLGALALGDIGKHFPDSSPDYKDADSTKLLRKVMEISRDEGYVIGNLDVTVTAEKPKLAPFINKMRENLSLYCETGINRISVKATTEEGLGLAGKGIGVHAVCFMIKK